MATVTSLGAGSGLDLEGLVTSLMAVERRPLTQLQTQVSSYNTKISSLGKLSSKLSALQTAAKNLKPDVLQTSLQKFATYTASLSKTAAGGEVGTVTATTGAVAGSYNLNVTQLAQGQKLTSAPLSNLDTGTLSITIGEGADAKTTTLNISSDINTPEGIRTAINQANLGISATVVNGVNGAQLTLTGSAGVGNSFSLSGIAGLEYDASNNTGDFTVVQSAKNAEFTVDGIAASSSSNTITDVIDGVSLSLTGLGESTLSITQDNTTKLKSGLEAFITAYNDAVTSMTTMGAYNTETGVAGELQGNRILREAQQTLSNLVFNTTSTTDGTTQRLSDIGITFKGSDGKLSLDSSKLEAALANNPEAVANLASTVGANFSDSMDRIIGTGGSIQSSTDGMNTTIRSLETRQEALSLRLEAIEARYRSQFSALDTLMTNMNSISTYLTQNLSSTSSK